MNKEKIEIIYLFIFIFIVISILIVYGLYGYSTADTNKTLKHQCLIQKATSSCKSKGLVFSIVSRNLFSVKFVCGEIKFDESKKDKFISTMMDFKFTEEELKECALK